MFKEQIPIDKIVLRYNNVEAIYINQPRNNTKYNIGTIYVVKNTIIQSLIQRD